MASRVVTPLLLLHRTLSAGNRRWRLARKLKLGTLLDCEPVVVEKVCVQQGLNDPRYPHQRLPTQSNTGSPTQNRAHPYAAGAHPGPHEDSTVPGRLRAGERLTCQ